MGYVSVILVSPYGEEYEIEVDKSVDTRQLLSDLIEKLNLPVETEYGEVIEYRLDLIGAVRIQEGVIIRIEYVERPPTLSVEER